MFSAICGRSQKAWFLLAQVNYFSNFSVRGNFAAFCRGVWGNAHKNKKPWRGVQIAFLQGKHKGVYTDVHDRSAHAVGKAQDAPLYAVFMREGGRAETQRHFRALK